MDTPERGYYCSADPEVISWWGWGDGNLDGVIEGHPTARMNKGITALLDRPVAVISTRAINISLIVEPLVKTQAGSEPCTLRAAQRAPGGR